MPIRSAAFALALATVAPASVAQAKSKLEFAYVVLGSQGAVARAVYTDATTCPSLALSAQSGKSTQPMSVRCRKAATRRTRSRRFRCWCASS